MATTSVRLFFPFGPGQKPPRLIPRLIDSIRVGRAVKLRSHEGAPWINPLPISRAAQFLATLATADRPEGRILDLGGPVTLSLKELSEKIGHQVGRAPVFEFETAAGPGCLHCAPSSASGTVQEFEDTLAAAIASAP